jgi:hypothetical protein
MNNGSARFGIVIAVIVITALLAGTWFVGIGPRLSEVAAADNEREGVELINRGHESTLERLRLLNDRLPELQAELAEIRTAIPGDADAARFYRELEAISAATGVRFDTISLSVPVPYMVEAAVEGSDPAAGINPDAAAAMGSVDETNFYTLTAQFGITGAYAAVIDAIALLQSNPRFVLVHGVSIDEGLAAGDAPVSASLDGQLFVLLSSSDVVSPAAEAPVAEDTAGG